ncbi:MAG: DMP19 family protein [Bacteroidaceae bacterium]|nr:DMP19 family protein [Bacteroidaceae bacterium]
MTITIKDDVLRCAAEQGGPAGFLEAVTKAVREAAGGEITAESMERLSTEQLTLWAFDVLRTEVEEGGFIQLIHNGWGDFFFRNPFAKMMRLWGLRELSKMVYEAAHLYRRYAAELTAEMDDDEFMALYESHPEFDELDDTFIDHVDAYVEAVATYVDAHLNDFVTIE